MENLKGIVNIQDENVRNHVIYDLQLQSIPVEYTNKTSISSFLSIINNDNYQIVVIDQIVAPSLREVQDIINESEDKVQHILYITSNLNDENHAYSSKITVITEINEKYKKWVSRLTEGEDDSPMSSHSIPAPSGKKKEGEIPTIEDSQSKVETLSKPIEFNKTQYIEKMKLIKQEYEPPFYKTRLDQSKCIGIWSPETIGVTTFVENFAIFLSKLKFPVGVLEAVTPKQRVEILLSQYNKGRPLSWKTLGSYIMKDNIHVKQIEWKYEGVHWYPFGLHDHDHQYNWGSPFIELYMNALRFYEILLVDFPSRDMAPETLDAIQYVDELWIMVNNRTWVFQQYKKFIQEELIQKRGISCKLLFNEYGSNSEPHLLEDYLEIPLLGSIPDFGTEIKIYNDRAKEKPILFHPQISELLQSSFISIAKNAFHEKNVQKLLDEITAQVPFWKKCMQKISRRQTNQNALHLKMIETTDEMDSTT